MGDICEVIFIIFYIEAIGRVRALPQALLAVSYRVCVCVHLACLCCQHTCVTMLSTSSHVHP